MAYTHELTTLLKAPAGNLSAVSPTTYTGDQTWGADEEVAAYGGSTLTLEKGFSGAQVVSCGILATVNCRITFTGATAVNGAAQAYIDVTANVLTHFTSMTGTVTDVRVGPNTTAAGAAGTVKIALLTLNA